MMPEKKCPKCGLVGDIADYFGYRKVPNKIAQSWCKMCRNGNCVNRVGVVGLPRLELAKPLSTAPGAINKLHTPLNVVELQAESDGLTSLTRYDCVRLYAAYYPNDKSNHKRSVNFMVEKLCKKLKYKK